MSGLRIAVLSKDLNLYSTRRLREAGSERGHTMYVINYERCYLDVNPTRPRVLYQGRDINFFDVIIPRIGASSTLYGTAVVRQFEMMDTYTVNTSDAISRSRDKLMSMQLLANHGVDLPTTGYAHSTKDIDGLIDIAGGVPLVVKLIEGTHGAGVILAETSKAAQAVIEAFRELDANILVQEFIEESGGADIRCIVVGGQLVAAMKRQAKEGEFRSNLHRGGRGEAIVVTEAEREIACRAAQVLGLNVAGVDLLRSQDGPVVIEINSSPGLQGVEEASQVDVATRIIEHVEQVVLADQEEHPQPIAATHK